MELVVLKFLQDVANDPDMDVRCHATKLLVQLLSLSSLEWGTQILALINSILRKGLQVASKAKEDKVRMECGYHYGVGFIPIPSTHSPTTAAAVFRRPPT